MTGTITQLAAQERINDVIHEAQRARRGQELRRPRPISFAMPRRLTRRAHRVADGLATALPSDPLNPMGRKS